MCPMKTDFSSTSSPTRLPNNQQSRGIVADRTVTSESPRNKINHGKQSDSPQHDYASRLESIAWAGDVYTPTPIIGNGGKRRENVSHAPSRTSSYAKHSGTSGQAHSFPGRRK